MDGSLMVGVSTSNYKVNISSNGSASFAGSVISSGGFYGDGQYITNLSTNNLLDVNVFRSSMTTQESINNSKLNASSGTDISTQLNLKLPLSSGTIIDNALNLKLPLSSGTIIDGILNSKLNASSGNAILTVSSANASYIPIINSGANFGGNVGIGVTNPTHLLALNGGAYGDGSTWVPASDRNLKYDIKDISYGLNEILKLQPKKYYYKKDICDIDKSISISTISKVNSFKNAYSNIDTKNIVIVSSNVPSHIGLIAQDVITIIPELVNGQEGSYTLDYNGLIPVLINAIKEQQNTIQQMSIAMLNMQKDIEKLKK